MPILEKEEPQWNGLDPITLELIREVSGLLIKLDFYSLEFLVPLQNNEQIYV